MTLVKFLYRTTVLAALWAAMAAAGRLQSLTAPAASDSTNGSRNNKLAKIQHIVVSTCPWRIDKIMRRLESGTTLDSASATRMNGNLLGM